LVTADGCDDDTAEMVRIQFPVIRLFVNSQSQGSVSSRDQMLRAATGELVMSLDDDSYPLDTDFFARLNCIFEAHPKAAVITFPELRDGGKFVTRSRTPDAAGHYVSAYANCAAAMRRVVYLQRPGFPQFFEHMYEETDYALQCYADGYSVWFEPSLAIRHHLSPTNRNSIARHHLNARNELWSVWMRCPWPWLPLVSLYRIWRQFRYACTEGAIWAINEPRWWITAIMGLPHCLRGRCPIRWSLYYSWMRMARHPRFEQGAYHLPKEQRLDSEIRLPASRSM
jgi:GT2 family glycosyltransferase